jgi:hypothetical protein
VQKRLTNSGLARLIVYVPVVQRHRKFNGRRLFEVTMKKAVFLSLLMLMATGAFAVTPQFTLNTPQIAATSPTTHMGRKHKGGKKHKKHHKK